MGFSTRDNPTKTATAEQAEALILEFHWAAARLVPAGVISAEMSSRLMRIVNCASRDGKEMRRRFAQLLLDVLLSLEDGTLKPGVHVLRGEAGRLAALHLESVGPALFNAKRCVLPVGELRRLFRFGAVHFRDVVLANSSRVSFSPDGDRRRAVVLDVAKANEFVGNRRPAVPLG